jgi:hypothetical protein
MKAKTIKRTRGDNMFITTQFGDNIIGKKKKKSII